MAKRGFMTYNENDNEIYNHKAFWQSVVNALYGKTVLL